MRAGIGTEAVLDHYAAHASHSPALIHAGFTEAKILAEALSDRSLRPSNIFFEFYCGKIYQRHFRGGSRILLRDGFQRKRNREYEPIEPFSDLHLTFEDEGMNGFGDFSIVGDDFQESGGPAYAVAIHVTFLDSAQDNEMKVYHFVSDSRDTPKDPAGKFAEALNKLIEAVDAPNSKILRTRAIGEFQLLHAIGHFPGLGSIKRLSMNHHIETMAKFFQKVT